MLEELQLIQEMVGDLSGVGLWVLCGVLLYKLIKLSAICLIIHFIGNKLFEFFSAGISKDDAEELKLDARTDRRNLEEANSRHKIELNEVKAAYKILKEAKGDE